MLTRDRRRTAFTLIELLVVVSIIAVLVALTATAAFGVRRNMQKQNAEATLQKLDDKVRLKVKDLRDRIQDTASKDKSNAEYASAFALTGDPEGAKALMLYGRMKHQMPMSFAEAQGGFFVGAYQYPKSPAFNGLPTSGTATIEESAACLYAAIAPMGLEGLEQQVGTNAAGQKVFVDGFGMPIGFIRIAYDGNANEMNTSPLTKNPNQDPWDPSNKASGALSNVALWNSLLGPTLSDAGTYNVAASPYRSATVNPAALRNQRNHAVALMSAGINRQWIDVPATNTVFDGDNLFSYRLRREGAHGD